MEREFEDHLLSAYLDDELSPEDRLLVEQRLSNDAEACSLLEDLKRVRGLVSNLSHWNGPDLNSNSIMASLSDDREFIDDDVEANNHSELNEQARKRVLLPGHFESPPKRTLAKRTRMWTSIIAIAAGIGGLVLASPYISKMIPSEVLVAWTNAKTENSAASELAATDRSVSVTESAVPQRTGTIRADNGPANTVRADSVRADSRAAESEIASLNAQSLGRQVGPANSLLEKKKVPDQQQAVDAALKRDSKTEEEPITRPQESAAGKSALLNDLAEPKRKPGPAIMSPAPAAPAAPAREPTTAPAPTTALAPTLPAPTLPAPKLPSPASPSRALPSPRGRILPASPNADASPHKEDSRSAGAKELPKSSVDKMEINAKNPASTFLCVHSSAWSADEVQRTMNVSLGGRDEINQAIWFSRLPNENAIGVATLPSTKSIQEWINALSGKDALPGKPELKAVAIPPELQSRAVSDSLNRDQVKREQVNRPAVELGKRVSPKNGTVVLFVNVSEARSIMASLDGQPKAQEGQTTPRELPPALWYRTQSLLGSQSAANASLDKEKVILILTQSQ